MLNRDQQRTARAIGGYGVLRLLANPDNGWQGGEYGGGSGAHGWTPRHWTEYGTKGAKILSPFPEHVPVAEVTWKAVAEHARRLPADLRERITAALSAAQEHRRDYPPTYPSLGRPYAWDMPPPPRNARAAREGPRRHRRVLRRTHSAREGMARGQSAAPRTAGRPPRRSVPTRRRSTRTDRPARAASRPGRRLVTHLFAVNPFDPYPHDEPRPSPTSAPSVHRYCRTCDVKWEAPGDCWICGNTGTRATPTEPIGGVARMNHTENP